MSPVDDSVARGMAKWPDVPDVYGWLSLDRRGNFFIRNEKMGNRALREFICRNYQPDARGCWYFQNGPQRVFVALAYTPLVLHLEGGNAGAVLLDHCGRPFHPEQMFVDEEGSLLMLGKPGLGLLDDRDLAGYEERAKGLPEIPCKTVPERFGFVTNPSP